MSEQLYRELAGERLRADEGWRRYEAKNAECNQLREHIASMHVPPGAVRTADGTVYYAVAEVYHHYEDAWAAHKHLDDAGVPRADADGRTYSLVGRIQQLVTKGAQA